MKKILTIILSMMICCTAACAESSVSISAEGEDWMSYAFTLPDGRMIFTGSRGKVGNYQEQEARLLCLNPDRTVSWEYWDPAEGQCGYGYLQIGEIIKGLDVKNYPWHPHSDDRHIYNPKGCQTNNTM